MFKFIDAADPAFLAASKVAAFKGAVKDLSNNYYHALDGYTSSSQLKRLFSTSPKHYHYQQQLNETQKPSLAMILGSLVHCLVLTPLQFEKEFFIMPDLNFRTNEGKAKREELLYENQGKYPISDEMLIQANNMRSSVQANDKAMELLSVGYKEAAYFWECQFSNLKMKAKLDQSSSKHFVEFKTTSDAGPENFQRHAFNMNYDLSLVHYKFGLKAIKDCEPDAYFIVVEQEAPHVCQVYKVGEGFWQTGHEKWLSAVTKLEAGIKRDEWPGYFPNDFGVPELQPPSWAVNKLMKEGQNGV